MARNYFYANSASCKVAPNQVNRYSGGTIGFTSGSTYNLCRSYVGNILPSGASTLTFKYPATPEVIAHGMIFWYSLYAPNDTSHYGNTGNPITPTSTKIEDGYYYATFSIPSNHSNYSYFYPFINDASGTTVPTCATADGWFYYNDFTYNYYDIRYYDASSSSWKSSTSFKLWKRISGSW